MYLNRSNELNLTSFGADFTANNIKLDLNSSLPVSKSKKYSAADLYSLIEAMDTVRVSSPYFTRKKVHLYVQPTQYAILIANDEPVAELNQYDKKTGKKLKSQLFSVENLLPKDLSDKNFNTAAILFENKVHVLAASKSGGVYAVFDADSKKLLYQYPYTDKDKAPAFNYGPVTYETLPGVTSTAVLKEKLEDISMDKFCTELFKHSCALTALYMDDGKLLITLANYDKKELAAATSTLRNGMNTMTSSDWYISTSAGLLFEPGTLNVSAQKTTWNEINRSKAGDNYKKVETPDSPAAEYNDKRSYILNTQFISNRRYKIYFTASREIKIDEKILKVAPPKIVGVTD
jgi:hypothetical protein